MTLGPSATKVLTTSSSTLPSTPVSATPLSMRIRAISLCGYNRPIVVSVPENPDYMVITESGVTYDLELNSGNAYLSFSPLNGQALCPTSDRTGYASGPIECSRDGFTYTALAGDLVTLDCASVPALVPDLSNPVDIRIQTSGSCPSIIRQLGCQASGDLCLLDLYEGSVNLWFQFPRGRVRFKAVGEGWTLAYLHATAPNRATVPYVQEKGAFITIDQDLLVSGTFIQIECDIPLRLDVFTVNINSSCTRQPAFQVESFSSAQLYPDMTASILVSSGNNSARISWQGFFEDHSICITNTRTAIRKCRE